MSFLEKLLAMLAPKTDLKPIPVRRDPPRRAPWEPRQ